MQEFMTKKAMEVFGKEYKLTSMERILGVRRNIHILQNVRMVLSL